MSVSSNAPIIILILIITTMIFRLGLGGGGHLHGPRTRLSLDGFATCIDRPRLFFAPRPDFY
jgi:hypothetical protein